MVIVATFAFGTNILILDSSAKDTSGIFKAHVANPSACNSSQNLAPIAKTFGWLEASGSPRLEVDTIIHT
jgi:hypothetical protein